MIEMKDEPYQPPAGADMPDEDCITIVTDDVPLGKRIHADGSKSANVALVDGEAYTVRCRTHAELAEVIKYASERNTCALILGHFGVPVGQEFRLVSRTLMRSMLAAVRGAAAPEDVPEDEADGIHVLTDQAGVEHVAVCRTKVNAQASRWVLIDRDIDAQTPAQFASLSPAEFLAELEPVLPGISSTTRITTLSSSARVTEYGGTPGSKAGHTFMRLAGGIDRDWLKSCVRAQAIANGRAWLVNKYSRQDPGLVVAQDWRCLLDDSVLALERLVFCGAPTVDKGAGLLVHPQVVQVVQGQQDELAVAALQLPEVEVLGDVTRAAGREVRIEMNERLGLAQFRQGGLTMGAMIETKDGIKTLRQIADSLSPGMRVRCQAPFRESVSWAAFVGLTQKGEPFIFDSGTNTTYNVEHEADPMVRALVQSMSRRAAEAAGVTLPDPTPAPAEALPLVERPGWFLAAMESQAPSALPAAAVTAIERNDSKAEIKEQALPAAQAVPKAVLEGMSTQMRAAYDWMMATQPTEPQAELSLAATISLLATVLGRKVRTHTGLRTNIYVVATAATGTGKEHGRRCVRKALAAGGLAHLEGGDPASGPALVTRMAEQPSTLLQLDEFGLFMQQAKRENSPKNGIIKELLALTGSAEQTYLGTMYADTRAKAPKAINCPCLTIYATTTPETLYEALNGADMASGFVNRLMIVESTAKTRASLGLDFDEGAAPVPQGLIEWMLAVHKAPTALGTNLAGLTPETAPTVRFTAPAEHLAKTIVATWLNGAVAVAESKGKGLADLWTRFGALFQRLALIHACSDHEGQAYLDARDGANGLEIGPKSVQWAFSMAKWTMLRMEDVLLNNLAGSEHEALMNKLLEFIAKPYGMAKRGDTKIGGAFGMPRAAIVNGVRQARAAKPLELNNALAALIEAEQVIETDVEFTDSAGRVKRWRCFVASEMFQSTQATDAAGTVSQHIAGVKGAIYLPITESTVTSSRVRG